LSILSQFKKINYQPKLYGLDKADFLSDKVVSALGRDYLAGSTYLTFKKKQATVNPFAEGYESTMMLYQAYKACGYQKDVQCLSKELIN
jgi:hypothetical protein